MVDDLEKRSDEGEEPPEENLEQVPGPEEISTPEDALRELEALLEGAEVPVEGEEDTSSGPESMPGEEQEQAQEEAAGGEGGEKAELWKKILEQADQVDEREYGGIEDLEQLVGEAAGGEETGEEEAGAQEAGEEEPEVSEEPGTTPEPEAEPAGAPVEEDVLEVDAAAAEEEETGVEPIEGLEVSEPGAAGIDTELLEGLEVSAPGGELTEPEAVDAAAAPAEEIKVEEISRDDLVLSEVPDSDTIEGLEELEKKLEGTIESFESSASGEEAVEGIEAIGDDDSLTAEPGETTGPDDDSLTTEPEETTGPEDALAALEAELAGEGEDAPEAAAGGPEPDAGSEEPGFEMEPEEAAPEEAPALEEVGGEAPALEGQEEEEEEGELEAAMPGLEEVEEVEEVAAATEEEPAVAESGGVRINDSEDSIRVAIKAEILIAQGKREEALRLFEALHLWEPDRGSFKQRVEELRRQPE